MIHMNEAYVLLWRLLTVKLRKITRGFELGNAFAAPS